jgi:hypothetical protein
MEEMEEMKEKTEKRTIITVLDYDGPKVRVPNTQIVFSAW